MDQVKLDPRSLLDKEGHLSQWKAIRASALKIKEWDYYLVYNYDFGISLTIADNSYMGLINATFLDFRAGTEHIVSPMLFMPLGRMALPSSSGCKGK